MKPRFAVTTFLPRAASMEERLLKGMDQAMRLVSREDECYVVAGSRFIWRFGCKFKGLLLRVLIGDDVAETRIAIINDDVGMWDLDHVSAIDRAFFAGRDATARAARLMSEHALAAFEALCDAGIPCVAAMNVVMRMGVFEDWTTADFVRLMACSEDYSGVGFDAAIVSVAR